MKSRVLLGLLLLIITCSTVEAALTRPTPPTITNATFTSTTIKVTVTGVPANADSCHAVLLTDLTTGFDAAYAVGNSQQASGTVVTYAAKAPLTELTIDLDSNFRERYYIAVASSRAGKDSARIFSPWKVYGDANGLPRAISTSYGNKTENVLYRARKIGELIDNLIVVDITFSLKYADTTGSTFKLFRNTTPIVNLTSLGGIANSKKNIKDAIDNFTSLDSQLVIKRDTLGFSEYTIYRMVKINNGDSLKSEIIKPDGTVLDTANRKIFIIEDAAHRDIIKTISNLCRMPSGSGTPDPIYPATLPPNTDTNKVKLLTTAMLDLAVAHNSPLGEKNEELQGIFTNYLHDRSIQPKSISGDSGLTLRVLNFSRTTSPAGAFLRL